MTASVELVLSVDNDGLAVKLPWLYSYDEPSETLLFSKLRPIIDVIFQTKTKHMKFVFPCIN